MKKFLKIFSVLLSLCLLSACAKKPIEPVGDISSDFVSSESIVSSEEQTSSEPQTQYNDLLKEMSDGGKALSLYGDLTDSKYSEAAARLESILKDYSREISVVAYSLDNKKALGFNTEAELFCACTVKAPYTLYCCQQMDKGIGSLQTVLTYEKKHYESGTGDMQYSPFGTQFSLETALFKSMSISDNVGYMMSVDYFGRDGYNEWIESIGCSSLKIKPTVWSLKAKARELALSWREIYNYFESDAAHSKFLYNSCTNTAGNYATAALEDVSVSHKQGHNRTGDWLAYSDAGIVWREEPYIIVILTNAPGPSSYDAGVFAEVIKIIDGEMF